MVSTELARIQSPFCGSFGLEACSVDDEILTVDPKFTRHTYFTAKLLAYHLADEQSEPVLAPALGL